MVVYIIYDETGTQLHREESYQWVERILKQSRGTAHFRMQREHDSRDVQNIEIKLEALER